MSRITFLLALCACGGAATSTPVTPPPPPEQDVFADLRARLQLADGDDGWIAYVPPKANVGGKADGAHLFHSSNGKTFHEVLIDDVVDDESDAWTIDFVDPRFPVPAGSLELEKGAITVSCHGREKTLTVVAEEDAKQRIAAARLLPNKQLWNTVALGRDTSGALYYIDVGIGDENRDQVRLFIGSPGAMKEVPLIVADKRDWPNLRLVTQEGMLKVEVDTRGRQPTSSLWWTSGGRTSKVMVQDTTKEGASPWADLRIYPDERGTTPCDGF